VEPVIQYAKTNDGVNIAYYAIGDGEPPLVYLTPGSHLEREWEYSEQRSWLERLAKNYRLIRFDCRGTGLSDRDKQFDFSLMSLDIEAVVRKERLKRFALMGVAAAGASAILYAHRWQEQVSHLVLWCPYSPASDSRVSSPPLQAVLATKDWRTFTQFLGELSTGWMDMEHARRFAAYFGGYIDESNYRRFAERSPDLDLTQKLSELNMPVLVLQRREAVFPTVETAGNFAATAPTGRLVLLEGSAVVPFLGDTDAALAPIVRFLAEPSESRPAGLTEREIEILGLLAGGASNEQISRALSISTRTVERHIGNIYLKIGVHNRAEATAYAFQHGIKALPRSLSPSK
jgi:pimeloyl-ACP methyl ester carboxylesterase/DNA-binding CsgD family transcriptional regulator